MVQWTTGNIAKQAVRAVLDRADLELVGVYAFSAGKAGKDVGHLVGLDRAVGVAATSDIEAIIALKPDCVLYMPLHPDACGRGMPIKMSSVGAGPPGTQGTPMMS